MKETEQLLVFVVNDQRIAIETTKVQRIIAAVEVSGPPHIPSPLLGVIDLHGEIIPIVSLRKRFGMPERELSPSDRFIIVHQDESLVGLVADRVEGLLPLIAPKKSTVMVSKWSYLNGVAKSEDGLLFIQELEDVLLDDNGELLRNTAQKI